MLEADVLAVPDWFLRVHFGAEAAATAVPVNSMHISVLVPHRALP